MTCASVAAGVPPAVEGGVQRSSQNPNGIPQALSRVLMVSGRVDAASVALDPSFAVDAPPTRNDPNGRFIAEGLAVLDQGVAAYPSFVLFSKLLVHADAPRDAPEFQQALDAGDEQGEPEQREGGDPQCPQRPGRQAQQVQQHRAEQGEQGEAEYQTGDDAQRPQP